MLSSTSLAAFSTSLPVAAPVQVPKVQVPKVQPVRLPGVTPGSSPGIPHQALGGAPAPQPGGSSRGPQPPDRPLPRGSLLDLSV